MVRRIGRWTIATAIAGVATLGLVPLSWADCNLPVGLFNFDFTGTQYPDCFRNVLRGAGFSAGTDFGAGAHSSLNIRATGGADGKTWMTVVDQAPGDTAADNVYESETLCADILIQRYDNNKGAGVVALFNSGQKGLALILYDAGNTDRLVLATVDSDPAKAGKVKWLTSASLGSQI